MPDKYVMTRTNPDNTGVPLSALDYGSWLNAPDTIAALARRDVGHVAPSANTLKGKLCRILQLDTGEFRKAYDKRLQENSLAIEEIYRHDIRVITRNNVPYYLTIDKVKDSPYMSEMLVTVYNQYGFVAMYKYNVDLHWTDAPDLIRQVIGWTQYYEVHLWDMREHLNKMDERIFTGLVDWHDTLCHKLTQLSLSYSETRLPLNWPKP